MRLVGLFVLAATVMPAAALAEDCTKEVLGAFEKQRTSKAFRVATTQHTPDGPVDITVEYIPPSKMRQTMKGAKIPNGRQTLVDGERAFAAEGDIWEEMTPQFAQAAVNDVKVTLAPPDKAPGEFECAGKAQVDGKEYLGFRLKPTAAAKPADGPQLFRTIFVDPASGLPALNIVAAENAIDKPASKVIYSYPADLDIQAPEGAPMQKMQ